MTLEFANALCDDVLAIPVSDGVAGISFRVDFDSIRERLIALGITKAYDLHEGIDFHIQIDSADTFDTINLVQYTFSAGTDVNRGRAVFDAKFPVARRQSYPTTLYIRVRPSSTEFGITAGTASGPVSYPVRLSCPFSDTFVFTRDAIPTRTMISEMYDMVPDRNAYSKEASSARFVYLFQAFAVALSAQYGRLARAYDGFFLYRCHPSSLADTFGGICGLPLPQGKTLEEYRRVLRYLLVAYRNGGSASAMGDVLRLLYGYRPIIGTFSDACGWVLRRSSLGHPYCVIENATMSVTNPDGTVSSRPYRKYVCEYKAQDYTDVSLNSFVYSSGFDHTKDNNVASLATSGLRTFSFYVYNDNYYNRSLLTDTARDIIGRLKSAYEMYVLRETDREDVPNL